MCSGEQITLKAEGGTTYTWQPSGSFSMIQDSVAVTKELAKTTEFSVTALDTYGCNTPWTISGINVLPPHTGSFDMPLICQGQCYNIEFRPVQAQNTRIYSSWSFAGRSYTGHKNLFCFPSTGKAEIKGTLRDSLYGCSNPFTHTFTVFEKPVADFNVRPERPLEYTDPVHFYNTSQGDQITIYNWSSTAEEFKSALPDYTYLFMESGTYPVVLQVENVYGCSDTIIRPIVIEEDFFFYIPDAFTPNQDHKNDTFIPVTRGVSHYRLEIFNRWGERVFATEDLSEGWPGSFNGVECQQGSYAWKVSVTSRQGRLLSYSGHVTLIR